VRVVFALERLSEQPVVISCNWSRFARPSQNC
jgi:hypothetical protein